MPIGDKLYSWKHSELRILTIEKETAKQWKVDGHMIERVAPGVVGRYGFEGYYCSDRARLEEALITHQERLAKVALDNTEKIKLAFKNGPR